MAEKPDEVNAWLDDEDGNRAADLTLKAEDYTESVKLPAEKPGWMQREHAYTAGGEELEGWDGPEIENSKLIYSSPYHILDEFDYLMIYKSNTTNYYIYVTILFNDEISIDHDERLISSDGSSTKTYWDVDVHDKKIKSFTVILSAKKDDTILYIEEFSEIQTGRITNRETREKVEMPGYGKLNDNGELEYDFEVDVDWNVKDISSVTTDYTTLYFKL